MLRTWRISSLATDELGLHSLAVEDAANGRKFNRYAGHDVLTAYAVRLNLETGELATGEIAAFNTSSRPGLPTRRRTHGRARSGPMALLGVEAL